MKFLNKKLFTFFGILGSVGLCYAQSSVQNDNYTKQYNLTVIKKGNGVKPKSAFSTVSVMYKGTFNDGKVFDQSDKPIMFKLNGVIPCWTMGVQEMSVGEIAKLECPANLAYGNRGVPGVIPPNSPLNFEIELLSVKD